MNNARQSAQPVVAEDDSARTSDNLIKFGLLKKPHQIKESPQNKEYITELKAEISNLRLKLAKANRTLAHYETLLHNGLIRAREVVAKMDKDKL